MSTATANGTAQVEFASAAIPLLKEYTSKFETLAKEAREMTTRMGQVQRGDQLVFDKKQLQMQLKYLLPPATALARMVSGMVANGKVTDIERIELQIRLAEFEAAMEMAETQAREMAKR
jgi:hypothetical protein